MGVFKKTGEIRTAVIGYGGAFNMGRAHLREMLDAGMTPTAVCDADAARLEVAEQDFPGIETYRSIDALLKKSSANFVTIITPHNLHAAQAIQCLNAGRHVVCEKPMAIATAECDKMIAAAKKKNTMLSTYHNRHWDGCILHAVETVRSGVLGKIVRVDAHWGQRGNPGDWWRASKSVSGGVLYDWGVHLLEYSLQILDAEIVEVSGFATSGYWAPKTRWGKDTNEDEAMAVVRFKNGSWLTLDCSQMESNPRPGILDILGTEGSYVMDLGSWDLVVQKDGVTTRTHGRNPQSEGWRYYKNVADHLVHGKKLTITPEWARRPIHILDLANQSAAKGLAMRAKYA
jgi:scyllo-inositol 2-dehydrogenase (NADP+)